MLLNNKHTGDLECRPQPKSQIVVWPRRAQGVVETALLRQTPCHQPCHHAMAKLVEPANVRLASIPMGGCPLAVVVAVAVRGLMHLLLGCY